MQKIEIKAKLPLEKGEFIQPYKLIYEQSGKQKSWEAIQSHNSVAILLYHKQKEAFVLVKQVRITTLLNNETDDPYTYELCAGIVDKEKTLTQIAKEEILEECGYDVALADIQRVTSYFTSVGFSGAKQTMFYAEVDEEMRVSEGGGIEDEEIELFYLPLSEAKSFMFNEKYKKTPGLMMAFYWFFDTIPHGKEEKKH